MNTFLGIGTYKGEHTVDSGLRFLQINIPGQGKGGHEVPLYVSKSKAAGEIVGMLEPNTKVLLNGTEEIELTDDTGFAYNGL